jgi:mannose-1-phosphate guanylyltransferase/phosphomannomutase
MYGYVTDRFWTDVGTLEAYMAAHRSILDREVEVEIEGFELDGGIWLGEGAEIDPDAEIRGPAFIGENSRVEGGAQIREYSVLGRGVAVKHGAFLHRAIVHDYAYVGVSASLRGCVLGRNSDVKFGSRLEEGVVVADECHIGEGAVLNPQVKVYPFKVVDPGAIVSKSMVWQSGGARGLFGERGVGGLFNIDITPEMALRLALAYASVLPKGSAVAACRDATRSARIIKRSMVAGINAATLECHDLELVPDPLARFYARSARAVGGFSVRTSPSDPASLLIQFFDERGIAIDASMQRQLERSFYRDDLRRAFHHDVGELRFPARAREYYLRGMLDTIDVEAVRKRSPKLVVDYAFGGTTLTGPQVLGQLGAEVLATNAVLDPERVVLSTEQTEVHLDALRRLVGASGAELGAMMDSTGELLRVVDGSGRLLEPRTALLAFVALVARSRAAPVIALPVSTTRVAEDVVRAEGGGVVWTGTSPAALMRAADAGDTVFAGAEDGGYIFPEFLASYDAVLSLAKLLEILAQLGTTLREVIDSLPSSHVAARDVAIPWEAKGAVMRRLLEHLEGERVETIDGVKAYRGDDWALVVPHPQEPLVRVWAEAGTEEEAEALADEFVALTEELKA